MNRVPFDEGAQLRTQGLVGHEVDRAAEQVFQVELNAEVQSLTGWAIEADQDIGIAALTSLLTRPRAEQGQPNNAEAALQFGLVLSQQGEDARAVHGVNDDANALQ